MVIVDGLLGLRDGAPVRVEHGDALTSDESQSASSENDLP
jgi:hypothetical protein